jgi:hypothetical protein
MGEQFNKDLCEERHQMIQKNIDMLFARFNWMIMLLVGTLVASVANLVFK